MWRTTSDALTMRHTNGISIHVLRVEDDVRRDFCNNNNIPISIHVLRVEDDMLIYAAL